MNSPNPPGYSEHQFDDIELTPFPKHLPLRPDKGSFLRSQWRKRSTRIALAIVASIIILICAGVASFSVGKAIQTAQHAKHPNPTPTQVVTPSAVTTVQITQTSVATSTSEMLVSSWQSTEVATATACAVVESKKDVKSCEGCGDGEHDLDG